MREFTRNEDIPPMVVHPQTEDGHLEDVPPMVDYLWDYPSSNGGRTSN
jgi:hypothetical protein